MLEAIPICNKIMEKTHKALNFLLVNGNNNTEFENYKMRDGDQIEINYE